MAAVLVIAGGGWFERYRTPETFDCRLRFVRSDSRVPQKLKGSARILLGSEERRAELRDDVDVLFQGITQRWMKEHATIVLDCPPFKTQSGDIILDLQVEVPVEVGPTSDSTPPLGAPTPSSTATGTTTPLPTIDLYGSGNVYPFLKRYTKALAKLTPAWKDSTSTRATELLYAAFDYGRAVDVADRASMIAMSSGGADNLEQEIKKNLNPIQPSLEENYFLIIDVAHRPVLAVYRGIALRLNPSKSTATPGTTVPRIDLLELVQFIRREWSSHNVKIYLPEEGAATRRSVDKAIRDANLQFQWPEVPSVLGHLSDLYGSGSFFELVSELQDDNSIKSPSDYCRVINEQAMQVAAIASRGKVGNDTGLVSATYSLVVKLAKGPANKYKITNAAECLVVQSFLSDANNPECSISDQNASVSHVIRRQAATSGYALQSYLQCNEPRAPSSAPDVAGPAQPGRVR